MSLTIASGGCVISWVVSITMVTVAAMVTMIAMLVESVIASVNNICLLHLLFLFREDLLE